MNTKTQYTSHPNIDPTTLQFRTVNYKIKSVKQTNHTSIIQPPIQNHQTPLYALPLMQNSQPRGFTAGQKIRIKRGTSINQQIMYRTGGSWNIPKTTRQLKQNQKISYIDTFQSMIEKRKFQNPEKTNWKLQSKINLPLLQQNQLSKFTLLDPLRLPIQYLQQAIKQESLKLKSLQNFVPEVKKQLLKFQQKIKSELLKIQNETNSKMQSFKMVLKKSFVIHQQFQSEIKKDCAQIEDGLNYLKQMFDKNLQKTQNLQQQIFDQLPFELVQNPEFNDFQQKLF